MTGAAPMVWPSLINETISAHAKAKRKIDTSLTRFDSNRRMILPQRLRPSIAAYNLKT
jgi:hypothetical protein